MSSGLPGEAVLSHSNRRRPSLDGPPTNANSVYARYFLYGVRSFLTIQVNHVARVVPPS